MEGKENEGRQAGTCSNMVDQKVLRGPDKTPPGTSAVTVTDADAEGCIRFLAYTLEGVLASL